MDVAIYQSHYVIDREQDVSIVFFSTAPSNVSFTEPKKSEPAHR